MLLQASSRRKSNPRPSQQPSPKVQISDLQCKMKQAYTNLQSTYMGSNMSNETYLLQIYMRVLDKMLDDVVYAQEKVRMVNCDHLRQQKCSNYTLLINQSKVHCEQAKAKVKHAKQSLIKEKAKTQKLEDETHQIAEACKRKHDTLETLKSFAKKLQTNKKLKQFTQLKLLEQHFEVSKQCKYDLASTASVNKPKHENNKKYIKQSFRSIKHSNKDQASVQRGQYGQGDLFSRPCATARAEQFNQRISDSLWLYQPTSYRNRKLMRNTHAKFSQCSQSTSQKSPAHQQQNKSPIKNETNNKQY